jgi:hypothetical protein
MYVRTHKHTYRNTLETHVDKTQMCALTHTQKYVYSCTHGLIAFLHVQIYQNSRNMTKLEGMCVCTYVETYTQKQFMCKYMKIVHALRA